MDEGCVEAAAREDGRSDEGDEGQRKRFRSSEAGEAGRDDERARKSPLEQLREDLGRLKGLRDASLQALVDEFNAFAKRHGYRKLYCNQTRPDAAYYHCSCDQKGCFLVTFARAEAGAKGGRKAAREWYVKSVGEHKCEPHEPRVVAISNTWIPDDVKAHLIGLFDLDIGAPEAYRQGNSFAASREIPITWEQSDVKALFVVLQRLVEDSDTIAQLQALANAGHYVAVDVKILPGEKRILNLAFVATQSMQRLARLFAFYATLDSTYGKNKLQLPVQIFVCQTNEGSIVPVAVGFMRAETKENYKWLLNAYYGCYKMMPSAMIVDGDVKLREAIADVAARYALQIIVLLCVWHLFKDLEKNLVKKTPAVDVFRLKGEFYKLRALPAEVEFNTVWAAFEKEFGTNPASVDYLRNQLFNLRQFWAVAWTGCVYGGGMRASSISESLHSLLASGRSAGNSLIELLQQVDGILVRQCEKSLRASARHEKELEAFTLDNAVGFVVPSVSALLSRHALDNLRTANTASCFYSVGACDPLAAGVARSWRVQDLRYKGGFVHGVSQIDVPLVLTARLARVARVIRDALSKNTDLGKNICACCRTANEDGFDAGEGFSLMPRWEALYPGVTERERLCRALGFGLPKQAGSTNNTTHEGLLDVLTAYQVERDRQLSLGNNAAQALVMTRDYMQQYEWDERVLGVPGYKGNFWLQCGVVEGEEVVPEAERRHYCGMWFHLRCMGLVRAPKNADERVQCLSCVSNRQFRPKVPLIESVSSIASWDARGFPRILACEEGGRLPTINLICSCRLAVGTGLPCEAMLAVARTAGAVLSFNLFHEHQFSCKLIDFSKPVAVFEKNQQLQLDVDEVIGHVGKESAPSAVPTDMQPKKPKVIPVDDWFEEPAVVVTVDGVEGEGNLDHVVEGGAKSSRNKSRRYKAKKSAGAAPKK